MKRILFSSALLISLSSATFAADPAVPMTDIEPRVQPPSELPPPAMPPSMPPGAAMDDFSFITQTGAGGVSPASPLEDGPRTGPTPHPAFEGL